MKNLRFELCGFLTENSDRSGYFRGAERWHREYVKEPTKSIVHMPLVCFLVSKARVKRRSFDAPNLSQLISTLERPWSSVKSDVELNMSLQMYTTI